jgi:acetylornithine deacetylase
LENKIIAILSRLVRINSVNSSLSGGPGEQELAHHVQRYLQQLNLPAEIQTVAPGRSNVVAVIPGADRGRSLLLNSHLDTVGVENMPDPFTLKREDDKLFGRGTYDMKGSIAVMLLLADYFAERRPPLDIMLTFVADEEDKNVGMEYLIDR